MDQQDDLLWVRQKWQQAGTTALQIASEAELAHFAEIHHVSLPADLVRYYALVNGTGGEYDEPFFCFYNLAEVQSVAAKFHDYHGVPKYSELLHTWPEHQQFYVFADYMIHLSAYAIRLDAFAALPPLIPCSCSVGHLPADSGKFHGVSCPLQARFGRAVYGG